MQKETRILVVDDDISVLRVFTQVLKSHKYLVLEATTGEEGLKIVMEQKPDIVLCDVNLPGITGIDVCKNIKNNVDLVDVFVVLTSGEAVSPRERAGGLTNGADDYITKPIGAREFLARIGTMVRLRHAAAALRASEKHYRRLVEILPDGICQSDLELKIDTANLRMAGMLGYQNSDQLGGKNFCDMLHSSDRGRYMEGMAQALEKGSLRNARYLAIRNDGSAFPIELSAAVSLDEGHKPKGFVTVARDITDQKKAENKIQQLLHILNHAYDAIVICDVNDHIQYYNAGAERLFGWNSEAAMGRKATELFARHHVGQWKTAQQQHLLLGEWSGEMTMTTKSGGSVFVLSGWTLVRDNDAQSPLTLIINADITERKQAEQLLQVQRDFGLYLSSTNNLKEAMQRLIALSLGYEGLDCGAVFLVDVNGHYSMAACHGFKTSFECPNVSMQDGKQVQDCSDSEDPLARFWLDSGKEDLLAVEPIPIRHGDRLVAMLVVGSHQLKDIPALSRKAVSAITDKAGDAIARIQMQQALHDNQQLLKKTLYHIRAAVFVVNVKSGLILDCNPAATVIFGFSRKEMLGQSTAMLHTNADSQRLFLQEVHAQIMARGFVDRLEIPMRRRSGKSFSSEHSIMPIELHGEHMARWVNVVRDITDQKHLENELRHLPLRIIQAQEAERLRVARELHDGVNQVIASAKMRLQKIESSVVAANPATREMLKRCYEMLVQALEENRRIAHNLRPSELDELGLACACRSFSEQIEIRAGIKINCQIPELEIRLDPVVELNLFRIVQESIYNVEKHARAKNIFIWLNVSEKMVSLTIEDDGCGFDLSKPKAKKEKWSGIGLTNIRERTTAINGICEIKSVLRKGTTICVSVPLEGAKTTE